MSAPKFPIPVAALAHYLPHRAPMVWIDEVSSVSLEVGECLVRLRKDSHAMDEQGVRASSLVEWIAQSYAFLRAAQSECGLHAGIQPAQKAFLAAIRDAELNPEVLQGSGCARIRIQFGRVLGPISMLEGRVFSESGALAGVAHLKVFAE